MASGAATLTKTDSNGLVSTYGVPGESDAAMAYIQTKPLELGSDLVDKYIDGLVVEFTDHFEEFHSTSDLGILLKFLNRLKDEEGTAFVLVGEGGDDSPVFVDEDDIRVGRYVVLKIADEVLHDWTISRVQIFGEYDGDQDQVL